jgi:hypothetical protein
MTLTQTVFHTVNLILFVAAAVGYARTIRYVWRSETAAFTKEYMIKESIAGMAIGGIFVLLQLDWILQNHNESVGDITSWAWLIFDYMLALFLIWNADRIRCFCLETRVRCPHLENTCSPGG